MRRDPLLKVLGVLVVLTIVFPGVRQYWADKLFPHKAQANTDVLKPNLKAIRDAIAPSTAVDEAVRAAKAHLSAASPEDKAKAALDGREFSTRQEAEDAAHFEVHKALLNDLLQMVRSQLELYYAQHDNTYPPLAGLVEQLTKPTDAHGQAGGTFGPYLRSFPTNPFTGGGKVGAGPVGSSDWYYNENTGEFRANDSKEHAAF